MSARSHYKELIDNTLMNQQEMDHCVAVHQLGMIERMAACYDEAQQLFQFEAKRANDKIAVQKINQLLK